MLKDYQLYIYMIFVCNMLILLPDIVFNISVDVMYDVCYLLELWRHFFVLALVIANPTIFGSPRFLTYWGLVSKFIWFELLVLNSHLKLFGKPWDMDYLKVSLGPPYHSISKKLRFNTDNKIKV